MDDIDDITAELVGQFLAGAGERLLALGERVNSLVDAPGDAQIISAIGRELHTIKGESNLLGLEEMVVLTHACEDMFFSHQRAGRVGRDTVALLYEVVDTLSACVEERQAGARPTADDVRDVIDRLQASIHQVAESAGAADTVAKESSAPPVPEPNDEPRAPAPRTGPAVPQAPEAKSTAPRLGAEPSDTLRLTVEESDRLTDLNNLVSRRLILAQLHTRELAVLSRRLSQLADDLGASSALAEIAAALADLSRRQRENDFHLGQRAGEISTAVRGLRLQALRTVFEHYPSFVRRWAREEGTAVRLEINGDDVAVDHHVIREIAEPCLHLLRNSLKHGIEPAAERRAAGKPEEGRIIITARQEGELVRIEVQDDGAGIDPERVARRALALGLVDQRDLESFGEQEKIDLIFRSGLSTASSADTLGGRGVGLDIVKTAIDRMGGALQVESTVGVGTRFVLQIPVSLSLARALLVTACDETFAVPNTSVVELYSIPVSEIRHVQGREVISYHDTLLPLVRLRDALGLRGIKDIFVNKLAVIVLRSGDDLAAFVVDSFLGEREIVAQRFGAFLGRPPMTSGVMLTEAGRVVLLLHAPDLVRSVVRARAPQAPASAPLGVERRTRRILYAEDSFITREYAAGVLRAHGYEVIEACDGEDAWAKLQEESVDIVLTDLQMPRMDGFHLTAAVRRDPRLKNVPVVVLSTLDTPAARRMALDAGADEYLIKSNFSVEALLGTLQQVLG